MVLIEYIEVKSRGKIQSWLVKGRGRQYIASSFLGATPGCFGAFSAVTLYTHGYLSIGAIVAAMIATSGDGAFVMLAMFPKIALILFVLLLFIGIGAGYISDKISDGLHIEKCEECTISEHLTEEGERIKLTLEHFLKEHVYDHIIKEHFPKIAIWVAGGLILIEVLNAQIGLSSMIEGIPVLGLLIIAVVIGMLPGSEPHIPFVLLFAEGAIPFSVLLANSIVQDGHGLFPMLSFTVRDSIIVKVFNGVIGLIIGLVVVLVGW